MPSTFGKKIEQIGTKKSFTIFRGSLIRYYEDSPHPK